MSGMPSYVFELEEVVEESEAADEVEDEQEAVRVTSCGGIKKESNEEMSELMTGVPTCGTAMG